MKAVVPVAGLGTRFLPVTQSIPKEMFPLLNRPMIDWIAEACIQAGLDEIILVTRAEKKIVEEYVLANENLSSRIKVTSVVQERPLGLGHAVLSAKGALKSDDYFSLLLPDEIFFHPTQLPMGQMIARFKTKPSTIVGLWKVALHETNCYGIATLDGNPEKEDLVRIASFVEKPNPDRAPSLWAMPGRYILPSTIFPILEAQKPGKNGEIQLTDALNILCSTEEVWGLAVDGIRFDTGNVRGFVRANLFAHTFVGMSDSPTPSVRSVMDDVLEWRDKWWSL